MGWRAPRMRALKRRFWSYKIRPDLWLVDLFWPLKKSVPISTLLISNGIIFHFSSTTCMICIMHYVLKSFFYICGQLLICLTSRAGHASILPRQRDHVFRPKSCLLLQYYYICCGYCIHTPQYKYLANLFWSLRHYYFVVLSLSQSLKIVACRALVIWE